MEGSKKVARQEAWNFLRKISSSNETAVRGLSPQVPRVSANSEPLSLSLSLSPSRAASLLSLSARQARATLPQVSAAGLFQVVRLTGRPSAPSACALINLFRGSGSGGGGEQKSALSVKVKVLFVSTRLRALSAAIKERPVFGLHSGRPAGGAHKATENWRRRLTKRQLRPRADHTRAAKWARTRSLAQVWPKWPND